MIRIAAVGDVHYDVNSGGHLSQHWSSLRGQADLFLLAGDLTKTGEENEIEELVGDLRDCPVPTVAVLGNHDYHQNKHELLKRRLSQSGVRILDSSSTVLDLGGQTVGVFGTKGFCGGFIGACCSDFGEQEVKDFIRHTKILAEQMRCGLSSLKADYKIVLLHYAPVPDTLEGEKKEIYPFLGSYLLGEAADEAGADVIFHGHAHKGVEKGRTPGGIPVRNVAQHVLGHAFKIYSIHRAHHSNQPELLTGEGLGVGEHYHQTGVGH